MITSPHSEFNASGKFQACAPETYPAPPPEIQTQLCGSARATSYHSLFISLRLARYARSQGPSALRAFSRAKRQDLK